jgi:hypothetical protein
MRGDVPVIRHVSAVCIAALRELAMTDAERRRRRNLIIAVVVLVPVIILAAWAVFLAGSAGFLPWQPEPTRIPITPFANLPGASTPVP